MKPWEVTVRKTGGGQSAGAPLANDAKNQPICLAEFSAKKLKILIVLASEQAGLTLSALAQRCLVRDLERVRLECRILKQNWGMLDLRYAEHGKQTWLLVGSLKLLKGSLYWQAWGHEAPEKTVRHAEKAASRREKAGTALAQVPPAPEKTVSHAEKAASRREKAGTALAQVPPEPGKTVRHAEKAASRREKAGTALAQMPPAPEKTVSHAEKAASRRKKAGTTAAESLVLKESYLLESLILDPKSDNLLDSDRNLEPAVPDSQERENRRLLENADLLFGKAVTWNAGFAFKPRAEVLGWLAQAWQAHKRGKSDRPWGLAYRGLLGTLTQKLADKNYRANPDQYLPAEFLEACGLLSFACGECELQFGLRRDLQAHQDECHPELEDGLVEAEPELVRAGLVQDLRIVTAWQIVLDQLEGMLPRSTFRNWMAETWPVDWEPGSGLLSVRVGSARLALLLDESMALTCRNVLRGVLNRDVNVCFVFS
ncbi:MAG: hypothetical protein NTW32_20150 [Chloroflexi bacterium]|nr:hypothetical protein [Chloroflexota bacterium]